MLIALLSHSNVPIWEEVLLELDRNERELVWIKVPSHMIVDGNNKADHLASVGHHSQPLLASRMGEGESLMGL